VMNTDAPARRRPAPLPDRCPKCHR
jgi:hypothetical protein